MILNYPGSPSATGVEPTKTLTRDPLTDTQECTKALSSRQDCQYDNFDDFPRVFLNHLDGNEFDT